VRITVIPGGYQLSPCAAGLPRDDPHRKDPVSARVRFFHARVAEARKEEAPTGETGLLRFPGGERWWV